MKASKKMWKKRPKPLCGAKKIAAVGGQLLGAAFSFIGEIFSGKEETEQTVQMAEAFKSRLSECLEKGDDGQLKMTITFRTNLLSTAWQNLWHRC